MPTNLQGARRLKRMSLGEKEQEFLAALSVCIMFPSLLPWCLNTRVTCGVPMQAYYFGEKPEMSNEEFDNLREELLWEGSRVAVLR